MSDPRFKHVQYLWKDEEVAKMSPSERLVYRSNRLGDDLTLTNTGGGNTSAKVVEKDPMTGKDVEVLWIKGSGGEAADRAKHYRSQLFNGAPWVPSRAAVASAPGDGGWIPAPLLERLVHPRLYF
jgi:hypothetical protein